MNTLDQQKRKDAIKGLISIAILESILMLAVVISYLYFGEIAHLIGGIVASTILTGPMFLRWHKEYRDVLKVKPNSGEISDD